MSRQEPASQGGHHSLSYPKGNIPYDQSGVYQEAFRQVDHLADKI